MSHCRQTWLSYFYKNLQLTFKNKTGFFYPGLLNHISVTHFCFTENCLNFDKLLTHHVKNCENSIFVSCFNNYCFHTFPWLLIMKNQDFHIFCFISQIVLYFKYGDHTQNFMELFSEHFSNPCFRTVKKKKRIILE